MSADASEQAQRESGPAEHNGDGRPRSQPSPAESFQRLGRLIPELKEYLSYLLGAKADSYRATVRNIGIYAALGVVGFVALSSMIVMATVLFLGGLAHALGALAGGKLWLGELIVGFVFLTGLGLGGWLGFRWLSSSFRQKMVRKYEQRQAWQRKRFGRDVRQAADAQKTD